MNRARLLRLVAGWLMLAPVAAASVPAQLEPAIRDRVIAAAVQVAITFEATENGVASEEYAPVGSGTVVSADGFILTNAHVVDPATHREQLQRWTRQADQDGKSLSFDLHEGRLVILFPDADGQPTPQYEAEVVERDSALDLAVLRIGAGEYGQPLPRGSLSLPFVPLGDSDALAIGDPVDVFGYPGVGGDSLTYSSGIVSGFLKEDGIQGRAWIKSDASISGGSSGGTAVDRAGRLIGVPTRGAELDCRPGDTNVDGVIDDRDVGCRPTGGAIGQLRPVNLAKPMLERAGMDAPRNETIAAAIPTVSAAAPDPVAAALAADSVEECDEIGQGMWQATACHLEAGAALVAACTRPFINTSIIKGQLLLKDDEALVICSIEVSAIGDRQIFLLPDQFRLVTSDGDDYSAVPGFQGSEFVLDPLCPSPQAIPTAGGRCGTYPNAAPPGASENCYYAVFQAKQSGKPVPPECAAYATGHYVPPETGQLHIRLLQSDTITPSAQGEGLESVNGSLIFRVKALMPVPFLLVWEPSPDTEPRLATIVNDRFLDPADIP